MEPSSASNRQITLLRKLNRKKYRQKEQLFLIEGGRALDQVLQNKVISVKALFFDQAQKYWQRQPWEDYSSRIDANMLPEEIFDEVSDTNNPQGVLGMCRIPAEITVKKLKESSGVIIALDGIQDPGNLGTIIRTATWFGASAVISGKGTVDLFHPKVVRGTAGATGVLPHLNVELADIFSPLEKTGWSIFLLDAGADSVPLAEISSTEKAILVVGNEAHGVDSKYASSGRRKVRISSPVDDRGVESLNAAVATSIALYDFTGKLENE